MTNASDGPPDIKDVLTPELLMHGYWHVASLSAGNFWPTKAQKLRWHGTDFWIIPVTKQACPAIATRGTHGNLEEQKLLMRSISMLSWVEDTGYELEGGGLSGGNLPRPMGRPERRIILTRGSAFDLPYFPEVSDERAMRALGLMREGRSLNHVGYAFGSGGAVPEADGAARPVTGAVGLINPTLTGMRRSGARIRAPTPSRLRRSERIVPSMRSRRRSSPSR
jgi:hypothetical protein